MSDPAPTIPAFLHVDVEPDRFQIARNDPRRWDGFQALHEFLATLRDALERATESRPRFGWFVRTDPQIAEAFGRADDVMHAFPERFEALRSERDHFGVHAHAVRWSKEHGAFVHDLANEDWLRECTEFSLDEFERATGSPARLYRSGAGHLDEAIVDVLDARGVELDLTLEPARRWAQDATRVATAVDDSPVVGRFPDCSTAPRTPYHPARGEFQRAGGADARRITLVPLSTAPRRLPPTGIALWARRLVGKPPMPRSTRVLYPSAPWRSEGHFWDVVTHQLSAMARPYLSLAIRTDTRGSEPAARVERLFSALPKHPLAQRLRFVDPLDVVARLVSPAAAHARATAS